MFMYVLTGQELQRPSAMHTPSLPHSRRVWALFMITALISVAEVDCQSVLEHDICDSFHNRSHSSDSPPGTACLTALLDSRYERHFDVCKTNVCFIFKWEAPMIVFNTSLTTQSGDVHFQLPFKCAQPSQWHSSLTGIALDILLKTSASEEFCVWAGHPTECTWNGLVHFTDQMASRGYQFTIIGPMLETPGRMCKHFTSTPYLDNPMVIIGRNTPPKASVKKQILQITSPFTLGSWVLLAVVVLLFITVSIFIVCTFHGSGSHSLITTYLILVGDQEQALKYGRLKAIAQEEPNTPPRRSFSSTTSSKFSDLVSIDSGTHRDARSISYRQSYFCTTSLCRFASVSFLAMFFLFYEAAVVQSLFQQQRVTIKKSVEFLSEKDLQHFAVMKDSALEDIWSATVDPHATKDWTDKSKLPWKRCHNTRECVQWLLSESNDVKFVVTYEMEGSFLVHQLSDCEALTITETKESLHHFNSGFLHSWRVDVKKRRQFDRELVLLRIDRTIQHISEELQHDQCEPKSIVDIGPFILLIPVLILVLPPLCLSVFVLFC